MKIVAVFFSSIMLLLSSNAANAVGKYQWINKEVLIQDYYDPVNTHYLHLVTLAHVEKAKTRLEQKLYHWVWDDLQYALKRVPNHPDGLQLLIQFCRNPNQHFVTPTDADVILEKAIAYRPEEPNTHVLYGMHLQKYPKLDEAIEQYKIAINLNPKHLEANYNLGLALTQKGDYVQAKEYAKTAYDLGYPLPGLKNILEKQKMWP